jgi:hypothetical protein
MSNKDRPSIEFVRQALRYEDGKLFWKHRPIEHFKNDRYYRAWNARLAGTEAGSVSHDRVFIAVGGQRISRHILIWAILKGEWPGQVDHRNRDGSDDRIEGLRPATQSQNLANATIRSDNTSGYKGVSWDKARNKWMACIHINGRFKNLGRFDDPAEAHAAYMRTAREHFGEFATDGQPIGDDFKPTLPPPRAARRR